MSSTVFGTSLNGHTTRRGFSTTNIRARLSAGETLGSVTVVATDKTGTITEGTMLAEVLWVPDVRYHVSGSGYEAMGDITASDGCSGASDGTGTRCGSKTLWTTRPNPSTLSRREPWHRCPSCSRLHIRC